MIAARKPPPRVRRVPRSVQVAAGRIERTEPIGFGYENTDVGRDDLSPVTDDYSYGDTTSSGTSISCEPY
jgi:hypothetical protein